MRTNRLLGALGALLLGGLVILALALGARTGHAGQNFEEEGRLGLHGYLRQSHPITPQVEVKEVTVADDAVQVTLCITLPTREPWNPYATLTVGHEVVPNAEVRLLDAKDPTVMQRRTRCYAFIFPVEAAQLAVESATLRLEMLWLELGNGYWNDQVVAELHTRAQTVAPGLRFTVVHERGKYGGGAYLEFQALPPGMTPDQAITLLQRLSRDEIPVAWQTTLPLK